MKHKKTYFAKFNYWKEGIVVDVISYHSLERNNGRQIFNRKSKIRKLISKFEIRIARIDIL